jgi:pilus assembly protein FimV
MARKKTLAAALVSLACLQAGSTYALGLGELTLESFLNEPLRARVSLLDIGSLHEDQIRVRLATPGDFDRLGVDRAYFLTSIKFAVEIDGSGRGVIVLTSEDPVLEPYLDFIVETRWPSGRLLRNYTVLVDPPVFDTRSPAVSASERVAAIEDSEVVVAAEKKTGTETGDTGTRVSMRESALAPGAMPQRNFGADTAPEPAPGARYMIRRDETLWTIAQRARVDGVSVQQTMLEIQRLNPDAFIDGNINRIKAGFIIYLPASGDISQADIDATLAAVRQQNEDWRAGRPSAPGTPGPALRISSAEDAQAEEVAAAPEQSSAAVQTLDELQRSERERDDLGQRLAALAERMETLERVVELKDAQIASLQQALAAAESAAVTVPVTESPPVGDQLTAVTDAPGAIVDPSAEPALAESAMPAPTPTPAPAPAPASSGGLWNWLYTLGGVLLAVLLGLLLWRRRQGGEDEGDGVGGFAQRAPARRPSEPDAFADIKLRDSELDLDEEDGGLDSDTVDTIPVAAPSAPVTATKRPETTAERGYGERRHDQYASDVEAGDALAEADIYIAYGRYAQAIDLLRKALRSEPDNVAYRLKLVDLAAETGDRGEAEVQLTELKRIGQAEAVAQAEVVLDSILAASPVEPDAGPDDFMLGDVASADDEIGSFELGETEPEDVAVTRPAQALEVPAVAEDLSGELEHLSFLGSADSPEESLPGPDAEPEFLGLEIEDSPIEELDLAAEFDRERERSLSDGSEDDFVFADDGDPLSTKLDLARAYIDMGDDDGARQILEEVLAEGNDEQQQDARELLDRLG